MAIDQTTIAYHIAEAIADCDERLAQLERERADVTRERTALVEASEKLTHQPPTEQNGGDPHARPNRVRAGIMDILRDNPQGMSAGRLSELLREDTGYVNNILRGMIAHRKVTRYHRGNYRVHPDAV